MSLIILESRLETYGETVMKNLRVKAMLYLVIASVLWSTGGLLIKLVDWNPVAISGARSGISALLMLVYLRKPIKITKEKGFGAVFYSATVILFVVANKMTTAANVILLQYSAPIWVAMFSGIVLRERVRRLDWATIAVVMGGMLLFFVGDLAAGQMLGNALSVMSGVMLAGTILCLKLVRTGEPVEVPLLGNILTFIVALPFILGGLPDMRSLFGILLLGVFQLGLSYILFSEASKHVSAVEAILIPIIEPLLNPVWVFMFTGEMPGLLAMVGGLVVVAAVVARSLILGKLETQRRRQEATALQSKTL